VVWALHRYLTMKTGSHKARQIGFTLIELMIVITIFGIAAVASVPAMGRFLQSWRLGGNADEFANHMRSARSAAVMKNVDAVFQFNTGNGTYFYFEDDDGDGAKDGAEYQSATFELSEGVTFQGQTLGGTTVTFESRGNALQSGTITLENRYARTRTVTLFGGTGNVTVN
jgi:prepilin-type N-terminal cleavage/methylation domain-containing protein